MSDSSSAHTAISSDDERELNDFMQYPDFSMLPDELKQKVDISKVKKTLQEATSLSILVTGRTGTGKSTIINGLLGMKMGDGAYAAEGDGLGPLTSELQYFHKKKGRIDVVVWDSRGLLDGKMDQDKDLKEMVAKCSEVDLKLLCIDVSQRRFVRGKENADVQAMKKLTDEFGMDFWRNVMIILTFANEVEDKVFTKKLIEFKECLNTRLREDVGIPEDIVVFIKAVPAGHYDERQLPDREYWLSDLWFECLDALPTPEAQGAFLTLNVNRITPASTVTEDQFSRPLHKQPLVITPEKSLPLKSVLKILGCGAAGAGSGGAIGLSTLAAGGVGAAVGVPVGIVMGFIIGLALGVHKVHMDEEKKNKLDKQLI